MDNIFLNKLFTISRKENSKDLINQITKYGGIVVKQLSKKVDYFVQSYNVEDDGRLEKARNFCVQVVPSCWIRDCIKFCQILEVNIHALYSPNENGLIKDTFQNMLPLFVPPRDEWREIEEQPQCYQDFLAMPDRIAPTEEKTKLYVLPLICFTSPGMKRKYSTSNEVPNFHWHLDVLIKYLQLFFQLPVSKLDDHYIKIGTSNKFGKLIKPDNTHKAFLLSRNRIKINSQKKIDALDAIDILVENIPNDGVALIGITNYSIFEKGTESEIYGRATGDGGCIISMSNLCSVAQNMQFNESSKMLKISENINNDSSKTCRLTLNYYIIFGTSTHELMHCFGLDHCSYFACNMNACCDSETSAEENPPLLICPICLKKLQNSIGFNISDRYNQLLTFFNEFCFIKESARVKNLLKVINMT